MRQIPQMRMTKARDGGRTHTTGVREIVLVGDGDDLPHSFVSSC